MTDFYKSELTPEAQKVSDALDAHHQARSDEHRVFWVGWGFLIVSILMSISGNKELGAGLMLSAAICLALNFVLSLRTYQRRTKAKKLLDIFKYKQAVPLYWELVEKFAEEPKVHIHLNDNGSITVTDNRVNNKEKK